MECMRHACCLTATALCSLVLLLAGCAGRSLAEAPEGTEDNVGQDPGVSRNDQEPPAGHTPTSVEQPADPIIDLSTEWSSTLPDGNLYGEEACRMQPQGTRN